MLRSQSRTGCREGRAVTKQRGAMAASFSRTRYGIGHWFHSFAHRVFHEPGENGLDDGRIDSNAVFHIEFDDVIKLQPINAVIFCRNAEKGPCGIGDDTIDVKTEAVGTEDKWGHRWLTQW